MDKKIPTLNEIFERGDRIPQKKYTTQEIVELIHEAREERVRKHINQPTPRPPTADTHPK